MPGTYILLPFSNRAVVRMNSNVDELDLKILAELDRDVRAPVAGIARKTEASINTVKNRMGDLEQAGVIKGYSIMVDFSRLGYLCNRLYLKLQYANRKVEESMLEYLKQSPHCAWCSHSRGKFDVAALLLSKSNVQFLAIWNEFKKSFKPYVREVALVNYYGDVMTCLPFTKEVYKDERRQTGLNEKVEIDQKDRMILEMLCANGRIPFTSIGEAVNLTSTAVKYRVDQLIEKKVIVASKLKVDLEKLGYLNFKIDFDLDAFEEKEKLEQCILDKSFGPQVIRTSSWADVEAQLCVKSEKELDAGLHEIRDQFSEQLRGYEVYEFTDEVKNVYMPGF